MALPLFWREAENLATVWKKCLNSPTMSTGQKELESCTWRWICLCTCGFVYEHLCLHECVCVCMHCICLCSCCLVVVFVCVLCHWFTAWFFSPVRPNLGWVLVHVDQVISLQHMIRDFWFMFMIFNICLCCYDSGISPNGARGITAVMRAQH